MNFFPLINLIIVNHKNISPRKFPVIRYFFHFVAFELPVKVNDTIIGDPLFTLPIYVPEEQLEALNIKKLSLCYEIHGKPDQWFNLVTDECTTVNAQYIGLSRRLNVIDKIGVRAVDEDDQCSNILVDVNQCSANVNGMNISLMDKYSSGGINVKRYSNRVRISVPNCADITLVMWVICQHRPLDNPDVPGTKITADLIKFVIMRGLNFGHRLAHGLLGKNDSKSQCNNLSLLVYLFTYHNALSHHTRTILECSCQH